MKNQICIYHMISYIFLISNFILRVLYILTFDNVYTWTNSNYSTTWKKYILPTNYFKMRKSFLRRILTWIVGCSYETRFKRIFLYVSNSLYLRTWSLYPFVSGSFYLLKHTTKYPWATIEKENKIVYIILVFKYFEFLDKKTPFLAYLHSFKMK